MRRREFLLAAATSLAGATALAAEPQSLEYVAFVAGVEPFGPCVGTDGKVVSRSTAHQATLVFAPRAEMRRYTVCRELRTYRGRDCQELYRRFLRDQDALMRSF